MEGLRTMDRKRIHNPDNRTYYKIRERTTTRGKKGHILARWSLR